MYRRVVAMIEGVHPVGQALLGTLFTWGLTAAGSALVFLFSSGQRKILDGSLGFAAGVMTAASYWSLLEPAIQVASSSGYYGEDGQLAFIPVGFGFVLGALFVYGADQILPILGVSDPVVALSLETGPKFEKETSEPDFKFSEESMDLTVDNASGAMDVRDLTNSSNARRRGGGSATSSLSVNVDVLDDRTANGQPNSTQTKRPVSWRRIMLLILAITVHNIPEGLAVGVGFGAVGRSPGAAFAKARNLAIGIGIQNFPEGLAVSLPLRGAGMSVWKSFWYGQLSGLVEPIAGLLGAVAIVVAEPILPYSLAFAAGAMIYVVVDDIIPEAHTCGNGKLASFGAIFGFVVMMSLDVGLG